MKTGLSVILVSNNDENLIKSAQSIVIDNEDIDIQIIVASFRRLSHEDEIRELCKENKIKIDIVYGEDKSRSGIMNQALQTTCYEYVSFLVEEDSFEVGTLKEACMFLSQNEKLVDLVAFPIKYHSKEHSMNGKRFLSNKIINLEETPNLFQYDLKGTIIKRKCFTNYEFSESMPYNMENHFILQCLSKNPKYGVIKTGAYLSKNYLIDQYKEVFWTRNTDWYLDAARNFFIKLLEEIKQAYKTIPFFVQYALFYELQFRFAANISNLNKQALIGEQIDEFYCLTREILSYIEDDIILNRSEMKIFVLGKTFSFNLLKLKYGDFNLKLDEVYASDDVIGTFNKNFVVNMKAIPVKITSFEFEQNKIEIYFELTCPFEKERYKIYVNIDDEMFESTPVQIYNTSKCFGRTFYYRHTYKAVALINNKKQRVQLNFIAIFGKVHVPLKIKIIKSHAKLTTDSQNAYWYKEQYIIQANSNGIVIRKTSKIQHIYQEIKLLKELFFKDNVGKFAFLLRMIYWITQPYFKNKRIWLTFDKKYKGGDNGEYFFQYASKQKDNIKKYYLLERSSFDYQRLKKQKLNIVSSRTIKLYLILLNTDIVFATHCDVIAHVEFPEAIEKYFRGLFNFETVCIQHGLTIQHLAHTANKIFDNTKYYYCASKYEIENLLNPVYGYTNKELKLTGLPRYDGLITNDKKQILIAPTWRRSISTKVQNGKIRPYNTNFKNTPYFILYNNLLNNEKLINKAKESEYKIIFLLHPTYSAQKNDFTLNELSEIITADMGVSYEKLLTESSLMITDYSGVQFDFAYMRKPIVYSHFKEVPPYFEEGSFNYETMAFGELCSNIDEIVDTVCEYIDSNCQMKQQYIMRCDDFFEYNDTNSCKRIYDESIKHQKKLDQRSHG